MKKAYIWRPGLMSKIRSDPTSEARRQWGSRIQPRPEQAPCLGSVPRASGVRGPPLYTRCSCGDCAERLGRMRDILVVRGRRSSAAFGTAVPNGVPDARFSAMKRIGHSHHLLRLRSPTVCTVGMRICGKSLRIEPPARLNTFVTTGVDACYCRHELGFL